MSMSCSLPYFTVTFTYISVFLKRSTLHYTMPEAIENDVHCQMRSSAIEGEFDKVKQLLEDGANVNSLNQVSSEPRS